MPYKNCLCREGWANPTTVLTIEIFIIIWIAPPVACLLNKQSYFHRFSRYLLVWRSGVSGCFGCVRAAFISNIFCGVHSLRDSTLIHLLSTHELAPQSPPRPSWKGSWEVSSAAVHAFDTNKTLTSPSIHFVQTSTGTFPAQRTHPFWFGSIFWSKTGQVEYFGGFVLVYVMHSAIHLEDGASWLVRCSLTPQVPMFWEKHQQTAVSGA